MDIIYVVRLEDETGGTIHSDTLGGRPAEDFIGEIVNVHLYDQNGNPIEKRGRLVEVLETRELG